MIRLSVNETKWSSFLARNRALILFISIWIFLGYFYLFSGPKSYWAFGETGPWTSNRSPQKRVSQNYFKNQM